MSERRFYFSTRIDRSAEAAGLLEALESQGWQRTYVWSDKKLSSDRYGEIAKAELDGIRQADVAVVLLPGGYGTHAEIGAALALGKPIILHSPDYNTLNTPYPCVFHYHPLIKLIVSSVLDVDNLISLMNSMVENAQ